MEDKEGFEMKGAGPLLSGGRERIRNLYIVSGRDKREDSVVIECSKCGTLTLDGRCPTCGIPLVSMRGTVKNGKVVRLEDFQKKTATICPFPERPRLQKQIWICGRCHEENDDGRCWRCGRERPVF